MISDFRLQISDCRKRLENGARRSRCNLPSAILNLKSPRRDAAFTLLECLAALMILMIGLVSVFSIFVAGVASHKRGVDQTTAGTFAQKVLTELQTNFTDAYIAKAAGPRAKNRIDLKDQADPMFPGPYKYDLTLQAFDARREAYAATLKVKWLEGGAEQSATFETVVLRKLER